MKSILTFFSLSFLITQLGFGFTNPNKTNSKFEYSSESSKGMNLKISLINIQNDKNDTLAIDSSLSGKVELKYYLPEKESFLAILFIETNQQKESPKFVSLQSGVIKATKLNNDNNDYLGSPIMDDYEQMIGVLGYAQAEMKKLEQPFNKAMEAENMEEVYKIQVKYEGYRNQFVSALNSFSQKNYSSAIVPFILSSSLESYTSPNDELELDKIILSIKSMKNKSIWHKRFVEAGEKKTRLTIGKVAPEMLLNTTEGKPILLSSLKGNIVLIDFWASWCGPCRKEIPNLKKVYEKYHPKGFEIYGVSIDKDKNKWKNAIKEDNSKWIHVIDDKSAGKESPSVIYAVETIPRTILLDKNGVIIAKDLRGEAVQQKLEQMIK